MSKVNPVIVVGSGPAGYTAALYTARAQLAPICFEGSVTAGGALMNTTEVENYPGFKDGIMGPNLMEEMRAQAERFGTKFITDDIVKMDLTSEIKTVVDGAGNEYQAKAVILATGSGYKKLNVEKEDLLSGRGVSYCATCDGFFFKEQVIAVVGGGDSAMEEATFLTRFASKVYVIHRRDQLRASKIMQQRAFDDPKIEFIFNSEVVSILGDEKVSGARIRNTQTNEERDLALTGLFVAIGHDPRSELVKGQVDLDENGYIVTKPDTSLTNLTGVFACGDVVDHVYRQAITAAGSGCKAALDAERWLASQGIFSAEGN
ncbi:MAG: thioredoxin-disulfide reductase [Candidatus Nanopelagicales bacterium]